MEGGGKVRGMKDILAAIDEGGERGLDLTDSVCLVTKSLTLLLNFKFKSSSTVFEPFPSVQESLTSALLAALEDGSLSAEVLRTSAVLQKALAASGAGPETVAKMIALQKTLADSGMPKHEVRHVT